MKQIYKYSNKILLVKKLLDDKQCDNYIQMAEVCQGINSLSDSKSRLKPTRKLEIRMVFSHEANI